MMEKYEELRDIAKKKIHIADHMLTMTYPMVKDPKLLLAVIENVFLGLTNSMGALLHYERTYKRVPPFQDTFVSKFNVFQQKCVPMYNISKDYLTTMQETKEIILQHKKSPVEFTRRDAFVICSDDYQMKTISLEKMRGYITKSKLFIKDIDNIINKNVEEFNRTIKNF